MANYFIFIFGPKGDVKLCGAKGLVKPNFLAVYRSCAGSQAVVNVSIQFQLIH
jgi:hypothetical protein